jgi:ribosomal protein L44E
MWEWLFMPSPATTFIRSVREHKQVKSDVSDANKRDGKAMPTAERRSERKEGMHNSQVARPFLLRGRNYAE